MTKSPEARIGALCFAFSDPMRRRIAEAVSRNPGATVTEICDQFPTTRFTVMRHLNILEDAGVVVRTRLGRERRLELNQLPFEEQLLGWLTSLRGQR